MRKVVLATMVLVVGISASAEARLKPHSKASEISYSSTYWTYQKAVPWGAYQTTITYGPGNRRCVSQLLQSPSGWWIPTRRCETVISG